MTMRTLSMLQQIRKAVTQMWETVNLFLTSSEPEIEKGGGAE